MDGSAPTLTNRTFVPGQSPSIQIRQDRALPWTVEDSGNAAGPQGEQSSTSRSAGAAPVIPGVTAAPASGAIDATWKKLPAYGDNRVTLYPVQACTGTSVDVATGVRSATRSTWHSRRMPRPPRSSASWPGSPMAPRTSSPWRPDTARCSATSPRSVRQSHPSSRPRPTPAPTVGPAQPDRHARRIRLAEVTAYQWTQIRLRVTNPTAPHTRTRGDGHRRHQCQAHVSVPAELSAKSDDNSYQFRLTTPHTNADGTTFNRSDLVDIMQQPDAVAGRRGPAGVRATTSAAPEPRRGRGSASTAARTRARHWPPRRRRPRLGPSRAPPQPRGGKRHVRSDDGHAAATTVAP